MIRRRFKHFMPERVGLSANGDEQLLSVSEYYGVKPRAEAFDSDTAEGRASTLEGYRIVRAGDFVMNYMLAWKGAYGVSAHDGIVSPAYAVYEIDERSVDRRYIHHRLRSDLMRSEFRARSKGIIESRLRLYPDAFLAMEINLPDIEMQRTIADFLDHETARIDHLIEKKQRLVELLEERRLRIIDELSTKGLPGNTTAKIDTKIDWLGEIPSHWTVEKLAWHFTAEKGRDAQKYTKEYCGQFPGPYPVYSGQTANEGVMGAIDSFDYDFGDQGVLFATTVGAKAMTVSYLTGKFSLSQNCMIIVPVYPGLAIKYFYYLLQPLFRKERELIPDHMQPSFRVEDFYRYWIAVPPHDEAIAIGRAIDAKLVELVPFEEKIQQSVDRLREFRSALITAAVTGQIDVTAWYKRGSTDRRLDQIEDEFGRSNPEAAE